MKIYPSNCNSAKKDSLYHSFFTLWQSQVLRFKTTAFLLFLAFTYIGTAATVYVDVNSSNPTPPYTSWDTAAQTIQDAVDAAQSGDTVIVTNGVYKTGGKAVYGSLINRVAIDKPITVKSFNGPAVTFIVGAAAPGGGNSVGAIRCAYVGTNVLLSGFTLTNGHTITGGDHYKEQSGGGIYCDALGIVSNCVLISNSANFGGGVYGGTFYNCTLISNSADYFGGGGYECTFYNCSLIGNSGYYYSGGAYGCTLYNCTLIGNSAGTHAGGVDRSRLYNCIVYYNTAPTGPNYDDYSTICYSCTTPLPFGEGNISVEPLLASSTHLSANSPCIGKGSSQYSSGVDIDGEPWLNPPSMGADEYVPDNVKGPLSVSIDVNYTNVATGFAVSFVAQNQGLISSSFWDFGDGVIASNKVYIKHSWNDPGEYTVKLTGYNDTYPSGVSATVLIKVTQSTFYVNSESSSPEFPYSSWETAAKTIQEAIDAGNIPGRLVLVTNGVYDVGERVVYGLMTNRIVLTQGVMVKSVNGPTVTFIVGSEASGGGNGDGAIRCAYVGADAILSGFTLTNGHTRISEDNEGSGGGVWCETSGIISNCVLISNSAVHYGGGVHKGILYNCILTGNSAHYGGGVYGGTLYNCTLTGNSSINYVYSGHGGGVYGCTLYNCTLTGNSAYYGGGVYGGTLYNCTLNSNSSERMGGGADISTLYNCTLTGNSALAGGGGAQDGRLYNCTLIGNSAEYGSGGTSGSTLYNCIVYYNTASDEPNYDSNSKFYYSCTTPLPRGEGNIDSAPLFVDLSNGNLRLQSNSPCINAGDNDYVSASIDLDGRPRIVDGTVDMGAYEFQSAVPGQFIGWLQNYGLPTDGSADNTDSDNDGFDNWQEFQLGLNPIISNIGGHFKGIQNLSNKRIRLNFIGKPGKRYQLETSSNLIDWVEFISISITNSDYSIGIDETNNAPIRFYRSRLISE